ncbi:hypothetical protein ACFQ10_19660 [Streptomyces indonesiensis]
MTITDEDCLAETLAFNEKFEADAASRQPVGRCRARPRWRSCGAIGSVPTPHR